MNASNASPSTPRTRSRRWLGWTVAALLLALLVLGLRPAPAPVETATASFGPLRSSVSEEGKTRIRQRYVVSSPVSGHLRRIELKPGARVEAGSTILARIDPLPSSPLDARTRALAQARRDAAAAQLDQSRANATLARSELNRFEALSSAGTLSTQDLDAARMRELAAARDLTNAEGALRQADAELLAAPVSSDKEPVTLLAQTNGLLLKVYQESDRAVAQGTPLLEIGDPADLEVVAEMLSRDGAAIQPGARVEIEQWGGPLPLDGRVRLVEPAAFTKISALGVEEQRVNVVVDILTPLEQRRTLGDNFRVENRVFLWESDHVLRVPSSSLFRHGSSWGAFVIRNGRATLIPVRTGHSSGRETEILEGLNEGDQVILYPGDRIQNGQRVKPLQVSPR